MQEIRQLLLGAFFYLLSTAVSSSASAQVQVAFFEMYDQKGELVQLEPGGRFFHVAVEVEGGWLHTHSYYGVQLVPELSEIRGYGQVADVLTLMSKPVPSVQDYEKYLGRPYDRQYDWSDSSELYCSELVRKLLDIPPPSEPMTFSSRYWIDSVILPVLPEGKVGASPDDDYKDFLPLSKKAVCERAVFFYL